MTKKNGYFNREWRKNSFSAWAWKSVHVGREWFTSHEVAKAFEMRPSTHVRSMLSELMSEGILTSKVEVHRVDKLGKVLATRTLYRITAAAQEVYDKEHGVRRLL